ncbi:MAG TPA: TetR/AcrR family transcriptional regulator [Gemmatimonadaceae bacterium]|jgi:AcrR family transcriptional regulator
MGAQPASNEPRWRRLPEERPRQILTAALEIFGEHGLAHARLDDIAKRAGLSKGTIYLYFPNKEELFREMVRQLIVSQIETTEREIAAPGGTATDGVIRFMRRYWAFIRSDQFAPLFRLIHAEIRNFPDLAKFYSEEVISRGYKVVASVVQRGIDEGEFRNIDPMVAARMLMAPMVMHGVWCGHRECFAPVAKKTDEQVLDEIIDFYLNAIRSRGDAQSTSK